MNYMQEIQQISSTWTSDKVYQHSKQRQRWLVRAFWEMRQEALKWMENQTLCPGDKPVLMHL